MAKKTSTSRGKKTGKRSGGKKEPAASSGKKPSKRPGAKKSAKKSAAKKKTTKKSVGKKVSQKKATDKAGTTKKSVKKSAKKSTKRTAKKAGGKSAKKSADKTPVKPGQSAAPASAARGSGADAKASDAGKSGRKGITIVSDKGKRPPRRSRPKAPETRRPVGSQLLGPGSPKRLPLIPSGPKAPKAEVLAQAAAEGKVKSPFKKRELDRFRQLLINKRRSLVGDVSQLETEALRSNSGGLSHTPQHMAEQGSDSADQSLSLGLAAADRRLIKEIDAALQRIDEGRFGICELSGRPIRAERLKELPWARYSIEAARQRERNMHRGSW